MSSLSPHLKSLSLNTSATPGARAAVSLKESSETSLDGFDGMRGAGPAGALSSTTGEQRKSASTVPLKPPAEQRGRAGVRRKFLPPPESPRPGTPRTTVANLGEKLLEAGLADDCATLMRGYLSHEGNHRHVGLNKVYGRALLAQGKAAEAHDRLSWVVNILCRGKADAQTRMALAEAQWQDGCRWEDAAETLGVRKYFPSPQIVELPDGTIGTVAQSVPPPEPPADSPCMGSPRWNLMMSRLLRQRGRVEEAVWHITQALGEENNPGDDEFIEAGLVAMAQGQYGIALTYLLEDPGEAPQAPVALAEALCREKRHATNVRKFPVQAIAAEPRLAKFVAMSCAALDRFPDADLLARVALSEDPDDAEMHSLLKSVTFVEDLFDEQARIKESIAADPRLARFVGLSCPNLSLNRRWKYADVQLLASVALSPSSGDAAMQSRLQKILFEGVVDRTKANAETRLLAHAYAARPKANVDRADSDAVEEEAKNAAVRFLVALAQRSGPNDQSWDFWHACAAYKGPEAAFAIYQAVYRDAKDASYALRMGEKLVDWKALEDNTKYGDVPSRQVMLRTVIGAYLLQEIACYRPLQGPNDESFARRKNALRVCLEELAGNDSALRRFRDALKIPDTWEEILAKAENHPTLQNIESLRAYFAQAMSGAPAPWCEGAYIPDAMSGARAPSSEELSQYFRALHRVCPTPVYAELAARLSPEADAVVATPAL